MDVRLDATIAANTDAALYVLDPAGNLEEVRVLDASSVDRSLRYPQLGNVARLKLNAGNWSVICLTSNTGPVKKSDLESLLKGAPDDAPLSPGLVVWTSSTGILDPRRGAKPLGVGPDVSPDVPVRRFLDHLRQGALSKGLGLRAVTFHVSPEARAN